MVKILRVERTRKKKRKKKELRAANIILRTPQLESRLRKTYLKVLASTYVDINSTTQSVRCKDSLK